jgi:NADH:ubiquinone reductase (non-electrogenic)
VDGLQEVDKRLLVLETARRGSGVEPIEVVIVGSGYCGVELAATVAERLGNRGHVKVVDTAPDIVPSAPAGNREAALKVLASRNVELILGFLVANMRSADDIASPRKPGSKGVILELIQATRGPSRRKVDGPTLEADLVLWTVGPQASLPPAETQAGYQAFPLNVRGQADTDEMLRVKGHPRIFAIGDSAGTKDDSGRLLPATAQVAFQQADYAGWNLWAAINNRPLLPFRYQHLGEMMTLGTADAAVSLGFVEGFTLDGLLGHSARKLAYLYRLPTNDHKARVGLSWLAKSTISSISFLQDSINQFLTPSS